MAHKGRAGEARTANPPAPGKPLDPQVAPLNPPGTASDEELDRWGTWRKLTLRKRMMHMERILERQGASGDLDAAKAWLAHQRWKQEFTHGRPKQQRGDADKGVTITVVDDIAGRRAVRIETAAQPEALPPPQEEASEDEDR